jgi:hypothetical protein
MRRALSIYGAVFLFFWILCFSGETMTTWQGYGYSSVEAQNSPILPKPPAYFIENLGQVEPAYRFQLKLPRGNAFYASDSILYQFVGGSGDSTQVENLVIQIVGADSKAELIGRQPGRARFHFYRGADPEAWITGAPGYRRLVYRNIYPHIDLQVEWKDGRLKHEFHVHPGGRVADIALDYSGIREMKIDGEGRLAMRTSSRILLEDTPFTYQTVNGHRLPVESRYVVRGGRQLTYEVGEYRQDLDLVIDPSLVYSTFLGGSKWDYGADLVVDKNLNAYIVGRTKSGNFPKTPGAHDRVKAESEAFLAKLDSTGSDLLFSTYFGGNGHDGGDGIAFSWNDSSPVITGSTTSDDLPILGGYKRSLGGDWDLFIAKFDETGTLTASTYFGGSGYEDSAQISVDGSGFIFLAGLTTSADLPISPGAVDSVYSPSPDPFIVSSSNLFITKFNTHLDSLLYSTFYGDYGFRDLGGLVADYDGHAHVAGTAELYTFPTTPGSHGFSGHGNDGFLLKLSTDGTAVEYAALITFNHWENMSNVTGLDVDGAGNAYVSGQMRMEPDYWYWGFISKFNTTGSDRLFIHHIGPQDRYWHDIYYVSVQGIALDGRGGLYATVSTDRPDMVTTEGAFQTAPNGPRDIYLVKWRVEGGGDKYATYLGGSGYDYAHGIAADSYGSIYITGSSSSSDFPTTPGAYDSSLGGESDAFIARIRDTAAAGRMHLNKELLKFRVPWQGDAPLSKGFFISNKGTGKVAYQVFPSHDWLTTTPLMGECTYERDRIEVTVDPKGLKPGTRLGSVRIYSVDSVNSPQQLQVQFKIKGPAIKLSRKKWTISVTEGGANPRDRQCRIRKKGPGRLRWRLNPTVDWLSATPAKGASNGEWDDFTIKIDIAGLAAGVHAGTIEVTSPDTVDTETIRVTLNVQSE